MSRRAARRGRRGPRRSTASPTRSWSDRRRPRPVVLGIPTRGVPLARRLAARIARLRGRRRPGRLARRHPVPRRPAAARRPGRWSAPTCRPAGIDGRAGRPGRRRPLLRPHRPGRPGRAARPRPAARGPAGRAGRPRPPGAADPGRLRRQEPAHRTRSENVRVLLAETDGEDAVLHRAATGGARERECSQRERRDAVRHLLLRGRPDPRRRAAGARHRRGSTRSWPAASQEAAHAARPHRGQPLLRGLHPHPDLVRGWRPSGCPRTSSTSPPRAPACPRASAQGHRADPGGDGRRRRRRAALASGAPHRLRTGWIRGSVVNAGDGTHEHPTQALLDAYTMRAARLGPPWTGLPASVDRRRRPALAGSPGPTCCCCHPGRRGDPGRAADAAAGRASRPGRAAISYDLDAELPKARRGDDAAGAAGADGRRVLPDRARVQPPVRPGPARGWRCCRDHAIVMHPGPMNRGMEIAAEVADVRARSTIVEQVTNGVSVRMAVLYLLLGPARDHADRGRPGMSSYADQGRRGRTAGRPPTCWSEDGVIAEVGSGLRRPAPRWSTPTGWSRCPAWSTCTPTCASPAGRTPRRSRPAPGAAALGGYTAVHAMANTDPVADTAGVVEQVWRLGREAGLVDVRPVGAVTVGLARRAAGRARRDGRLARPGCGSSPTTGTASPTRC